MTLGPLKRHHWTQLSMSSVEGAPGPRAGPGPAVGVVGHGRASGGVPNFSGGIDGAPSGGAGSVGPMSGGTVSPC